MNAKTEWQRLIGKPVYVETKTKGWSGGRAVGILDKVDYDFLLQQNFLNLKNPADTLGEMSWPIGAIKTTDIARIEPLGEVRRLPHEVVFKEEYIPDLMVEAYLKYRFLTSYGYPPTEGNARRELQAYAYFGNDGALKVLQLALSGTPPKGQAYFFYDDYSLAILQRNRVRYALYHEHEIPPALQDFYQLVVQIGGKLFAKRTFGWL